MESDPGKGAAKGGPLGRVAAAALRELSKDAGRAAEEGAETAKEEKKAAAPAGGMYERIKAGLEGFRTTARWMIAAFGAVFVAFVGSTPFTDYADLAGGSRNRAVVGIALGVGGALLGIWAASRVFEPEDHSLAELKSKLQDREGKDAKRFERFFRPRVAAIEDYRTLITSEPLTYFGSRVNTAPAGVQRVIDQVGEKVNDHCAKRVRAIGQNPDSDAAKAEKRAEIGLAHARKWQELLMLVGIWHEMRGKYMGSRRFLVAGAVAVVGGVFLYFGEVTQETDDKQGAATASTATLLPVTVSLDPDPATRLERASGPGCVSAGRQAGFIEGDPSSNGPWKLLVAPEGDCRPIRFELKSDDGSITAR